MSRSTTSPAPICSTSQSQATVVVSSQAAGDTGSVFTTDGGVPGGGGSVTYLTIASFHAVTCGSTDEPTCVRAILRIRNDGRPLVLLI